MAILIIEQQGERQAGTLKGRVLIGRWPHNTVVIDDRAVSRIHAWIGLQDGRYYIADAGSRTGTLVNGEALRERHFLIDGDQVRIGPAVLRYRTDATPPTEAQAIDLSPRTPAQLSGEQGVFMDCVCGAPLWLPRQFAGIGQCRYCGHTVTQGVDIEDGPPAGTRLVSPPSAGSSAQSIKRAASPATPSDDKGDDEFDSVIDDALAAAPPPPPRRPARRGPAGAPANNSAVRPPPVPKAIAPLLPMPPIAPAQQPAAPAPLGRRSLGATPAIPSIPPAVQRPQAPATAPSENEKDCGVCHAPITVFDEITFCPSCNLSFHAECWQENRGCSAYGCTEVGALGGPERQG